MKDQHIYLYDEEDINTQIMLACIYITLPTPCAYRVPPLPSIDASTSTGQGHSNALLLLSIEITTPFVNVRAACHTAIISYLLDNRASTDADCPHGKRNLRDD